MAGKHVVPDLPSRVDHLDKEVEALRSRFESRFDELANQLESIEGSVKVSVQAAADAREAAAKAVEAAERIIEIGASIGKIEPRVKAVEDAVSGNAEALGVLRGTLDKLASSQSKLATKLDGIGSAITGLSAKQAELATHVDKTDKTLGDLGKSQTTLGTKVSGIDASLGQVSRSQAELSGKIGGLEVAVGDVSKVQNALSLKVEDINLALGDDPITFTAETPPLAPFLQIRLREIEFNPLVRNAIAKVAVSSNEGVDKLTGDIVTKGIGSAIGKVTDRLSRVRMSEPKRYLLAAAYPALLRKRLGDPINDDLAKDPIGLADSLIADLDLRAGPLDQFADALVDFSEQTLSLDLDEPKRAALQLRVRASI